MLSYPSKGLLFVAEDTGDSRYLPAQRRRRPTCAFSNVVSERVVEGDSPFPRVREAGGTLGAVR